MTYTTLVQKKFGVGDMQHGSNNVLALIANPMSNGSDLVFTNQLPVGDLEHPNRTTIVPKTYSQTNYFTMFTALANRRII